MRIGLIHPFFFRCARGIERYTYGISNALVRAGHAVDVITWRWPSRRVIDTLDSRVTVHTVPTSRWYAARLVVPFYVWVLARGHYDCVWVNFAAFGEGAALSWVQRQRFGIVLHYPYDQVPHRYDEFKLWGLPRRAQSIVAVSRFVADGVKAAWSMESEVIEHGVDAGRFRPSRESRVACRERLGIQPEAPVVVTTVALEERKGVQWMLRALPQVVEAFGNVVFLVIGEGEYRPALAKQVGDLGLSATVRFLGAQEDVIPFLQAADVAVVLAEGEASSLAGLEALACGLPVVAALHRPFDELLQPAYGVQVRKEDTAAVAGAVKALLLDGKKRAEMGLAGRARILRDFTWEKAAASYLRVMHA